MRTERASYLKISIDRPSKLTFDQLHEKANRATVAAFLDVLLKAVPYDLHTILTDNGIQFADLPRNRDGWTARMRIYRWCEVCQ